MLRGVVTGAFTTTFRMRRLDLAFYFFAPYWSLLGAFMWTVCQLDNLTF